MSLLCYFVTLLLCYFVPTAAVAQSAQSPAVESVLARIEFNGNATPAMLGRDLLKLNEAELNELCDMVVEPGTGEDTKARMVLQALTLHLSQEGTPDDRGRFIGVLGKALKAETPAAVKQFFIELLQLIGDERAVERLSSYVLDPELGPSASTALLAIRTPGATAALLQALRESDETTSLALISTFMQCDQAPPRHVLTALKLGTPADNHERGQYGIDFLSQILASDLYLAFNQLEDMTAEKTWQKIAAEKTWWERNRVVATILFTADALARDEQVDKAVTLYRRVMCLHPDAEDVHIRCAALAGLAQADAQKAVPDIVIALADENPELRAAAVELGVRLRGPEASRALAEQLVRSLPPTAMGILEVLGRRGDQAVLAPVLDALGDDHSDVRIAAVRAAAAIGGTAVLGPLAARLDCENDAERAAAADALAGLREATTSSYLASGLEEAPAGMKCALLDVLTRRHAMEQLDVIVKYMQHEDATVRLAAIRSVGALAEDAANVQRLIRLLSAVESPEEREAAEQALVAVCLRCPDKAAAIDVVLGKLDSKQTAAYCSLLRVLGRLPGRPAFAALEAALHVDNAEIREAAIRGMSDRPDPTLRDAAVLLETARGFDESTEHVLTMRAFANFVGRCTDDPAAERLALFDAGIQAARRAEERKLLLSKIAEVAADETIEYLNDYLKTPDALADEAASAMLRVAGRLLPHDWKLAMEVADQVSAMKVPDALRERARRLRERIDESHGYVIDWLVAGPYATENKSGHDMLDDPFPPENPADAKVEWRTQPRTADKGDFWHVDLLNSGGRDDSAMYLRTYVRSPDARPAMLELGSDDGVKVWLNGAVIHSNRILRGCEPAQDKVAVELRAGWNEIMLKVTNGNGGFGACLRVRTPEGGRIDNLEVNPDPEQEGASQADDEDEAYEIEQVNPKMESAN